MDFNILPRHVPHRKFTCPSKVTAETGRRPTGLAMPRKAKIKNKLKLKPDPKYMAGTQSFLVCVHVYVFGALDLKSLPPRCAPALLLCRVRVKCQHLGRL